MTTEELLSSNGYVFDSVALVWQRPGAEFIGYSDGDDAERKLRTIVSSVEDRSIDSPMWQKVIDDWPSEYHLSPKRANLLRPLPIGRGHRIVELGAGCGAITRWLGETGAEVIAVEGSLQRAKIAALRCQGLLNVHVVADNLHDAPPFSADWVTLIGVLEYAPVFDSSADSVGAVLCAAEKHLKPNGALVIAIENQLGLKYFAGCSEDHVGIPYFGIEGLYRQGGAITFGRRELSERFLKAGFSSHKLYLPFPDYKLPDIIVDSTACTTKNFDVASLVALSTGRDYSGQRPKAFSEPLAWSVLARNGVLPEFSNSFLFVVAKDQSALEVRLPRQHTLAWSYSGDRAIEFATEICFSDNHDGIRVSKQLRQSAAQTAGHDNGRWSQTIKPVSEYFVGERLDVRLIRLAASGAADEFFNCASKWVDQLLLRSQSKQGMDTEQVAAWTSDGAIIDLIPRNIIVGTDDELHIFDLEWICSEPVPLAWLLIRGVLSFALFPINGDWIRSQTVIGLVRAIALRHKLAISDSDIEIARDADASFLSWVRGLEPTQVAWPAELLTIPISQLAPSFSDLFSTLQSKNTQSLQEVDRQRDANRISHAKLIGAYEQSEKSNRSLIDELNKSHAFAAEALTYKSVAEKKVITLLKDNEDLNSRIFMLESVVNQTSILEQKPEVERVERTKLFDDYLRFEPSNQSLVEEHNKAREQAEAEKQSLVEELNKAREQFETEQLRLRNIVDQLECQQAAMNSELIHLAAESATSGAKLGRLVTRLHTRIAPLGTTRRELIALTWQFFNLLFESGLRVALVRAWRYLSTLKQSRNIRRDATRADKTYSILSGTSKTLSKAQANHPELAIWLEKNEPTSIQLIDQAADAVKFGYQPLISVIIPIYRLPQDVLDETLASLESQTYANWQACIVWSDVDNIAGWEWLRERCGSDKRFKLKLLAENGGISRNSNSAFEIADGEFIALLDHDDTITPWALFEIVRCLQASPDLDFLYSDKDSVTADGQIRLNALFKPEWSPEMLHSVNYLTHLNVIRTSLIREIGGWRPETDGAQDWDLFFRITERTRNIARVPYILYHWRVLPTSTATGLAAKPYAAIGQLKSQQDHFIRCGLAASVVPSPEGMFKVCWPVLAASTDIVLYQNGTINQLVTVLDVLRAGKQEAIRNIRVVLNGPVSDALNAFLGVWPNRIIFTQIDTVNWRTALESSLSADVAETILLLDGSAAGLSETLTEELTGWVAHHPDITWASAIALNPGGTVYESGRVVSADFQSAPLFSGSTLFAFGWFGGPLWYRNMRACSPYAVAIKSADVRKALSSLGTGDGGRADFGALCCALIADGRRGLVDPFARVYFNSAPEIDWPNDGSLFHADPYFSPSFSQVSPLRLQP